MITKLKKSSYFNVHHPEGLSRTLIDLLETVVLTI